MHALWKVLGLTDASGAFYLFWSGFAAQLDRVALVAVLWHRFNCHERGCWRIAIHHRDGNSHCRKHRSKGHDAPNL